MPHCQGRILVVNVVVNHIFATTKAWQVTLSLGSAWFYNKAGEEIRTLDIQLGKRLFLPAQDGINVYKNRVLRRIQHFK